MDGHGENLMSPMPCKQVNNVLNFHLSKIVDGFGPLLSVPCWGAIYGGAEGGGRDSDRMIVGFTTTYAIGAYHH